MSDLYKYIALQEINPCLRAAGIEINYQNLRPKRRIYDYEFIYCHKGEFSVFYDSYSHRITSGMMMIVPPGVAHQFDSKKATEVYWLHLDFYYHNNQMDLQRFIQQERQTIYNPKHFKEDIKRLPIIIEPNLKLPDFYNVSNMDETKQIFLDCINLQTQTPSLFQIKTKALLYKLFDDLYINLIPSSYIDAASALSNSVLSYMSNNLHRKITADELANQFNYNKDVLNRIIKKKTGSSLRTHLRLLRLKKVSRLLSSTTMSLDEISFECGYTDRSHLIRVFKSEYKTTPSNYRKSIWNNSQSSDTK